MPRPRHLAAALAALGLTVTAASCSSDASDGAGTGPATPASSAAVTTPPASVAAASTPPAAVTSAPGAGAAPTSVAPSTATAAPAPASTSVGPCAAAGEASDAPVTLTMWHYLDATRVLPLFERWAGEFQAAHPGVTIRLETVQDGTAGLTALAASHPEDRPALVQLPDALIASAVESGLFAPVGSCAELFDADGLIPAVGATYSVGGVLWAAPVAVSVPLLYYDRWAFAAAGLDPDDPPSTFAELADAARQIVASGADDLGLVLEAGESSGGVWYVEQTLAQVGRPSLGEANGREGAGDLVHWDDPAVVDGLGVLRSLVADGTAEVIDASDGVADLVQLIAGDGAAAMTLHTSGSLGSVIDVMAGTPDRVGVAPFPAVAPGGRASGAPGGSALWLVGGRDARTSQAAVEWARFLASPEVQAELAAATGYVPVDAAALDEPALRDRAADWPQLVVGATALAEAPSSPADLVPVSTHEPELRTLLATAVAAALTGTAEPEAALAAAEAQANALLAS